MLLSVDFEFRNISEKKVDLVSACVMESTCNRPCLYWLHNNIESQKILMEYLLSKTGSTILSYYCPAESRAFLSLGIDPLKYQWLDPWIAYRALINAPHISRKNSGLIYSCAEMQVPYLHASEKEKLRNLILNSDSFSEEDRKKILYYCYDDTRVLYPLLQKLIPQLIKTYSRDERYWIERLRYLSYYSTCLGICEQTGSPIDVFKMNTLSYNYKLCRTWACEQVEYPFFVWNSKKETYVFKYSVFEDFLIINNLSSDWPVTKTGRYMADKDTLKERYHLHPQLKNFYEYNTVLNSIKYFNPDRSVFKETVGDDGHSRTTLSPYSTMTGRNAPRASQFLPAMSSVFRVLIRPEPGMAITSIDWSAQEFALGALLSEDQEMWKAYQSGDPYLYFAKVAGVVPPEGTEKQYKSERDLFKSTILGLQYSMGKKSLLARLRRDTGQDLTMEDAIRLIKLHETTFSAYWRWVKLCDLHTRKGKPFFTLDGWPCQPDSDSITSMRNFPIQSAGAVLLRYAIIKASQRRLKILFPLHDAIYVYHKEGDDVPLQLEKCMDEAVTKFFPGAYIRHKTNTHAHNDLWIESKAKDIYKKIKVFFTEESPEVAISREFSPELYSYSLF